MKKTKIVVPALAVLLLSTAASVSGTVAWFSMNNSVKVDGMTVTTKVSSNLLIAETNQEANYNDSITQARAGVLEPASTVDAENFFYTVNAKGDGDAKTENYTAYNEATNLENTGAGKAKYDTAFNSAYGVADTVTTSNVVYGYIDYSFFIKATSAADDQVLYMSKCNLTYKADGTNYSAISNGYAWRVGLLSYQTNANTAADDSNLDLKTVLAPAQAMNQNQKYEEVTGLTVGTDDVDSYFLDPYGHLPASGKAAANTKYYEAPANPVDPEAVDSTSTLDEVTNAGEPAQAATNIDLGITSYTRIVVRLWLEGEDVSCTSTTYANLTRDWKLTLEFKLGNADDGAQTPTPNGLTAIQSNPSLDTNA